MIGVIGLHSLSKLSPISHFLYITAVFSIPLFFMSSGYVLFGKEGVDYKYSIKKIFGIFRFVLIITVLYYVVMNIAYCSIKGINFPVSFITITFGSLLKSGPFFMYWYLGAMIIIYALLPIIDYLYKARFKFFIFFTILLLCVCTVLFSLNFINGLHVEQNIRLTFLLWNWLLYFCLGGVIRRFPFSVKWYVVVLLAIVNYLFQISTVRYICSPHCDYYYSSLPIMIFSIALFVFLINIKIENKLIANASKLFLPCYTIHMFVIQYSSHLFVSTFSFAGIFMPVLFWVFVCVVSVSLSWLIMKVPYVNRIFRI